MNTMSMERDGRFGKYSYPQHMTFDSSFGVVRHGDRVTGHSRPTDKTRWELAFTGLDSS